MISLIDDNREATTALCQQYGVARLAVFGSAVKGTLDPATSDFDFKVEFTDYGPGIAKRFMGLLVALEDLFGQDTNIVTPSSVKNPFFLEELERTAVTIYERARQAAAA